MYEKAACQSAAGMEVMWCVVCGVHTKCHLMGARGGRRRPRIVKCGSYHELV